MDAVDWEADKLLARVRRGPPRLRLREHLDPAAIPRWTRCGGRIYVWDALRTRELDEHP